MKQYNLRFWLPILISMILIMGVLTIRVNGSLIVGVISLVIVTTYIYNRSTNIDHYCVGVDLDTNDTGDIIEIMTYAFYRDKNQYYPIGIYYKPLKIFVDVVLLDKFYQNIGFQIQDNNNYRVRLVKDAKFTNIQAAKKFYRQMIKTVKKSYVYSANSMQDRRIDQQSNLVKQKVGSMLWNWWTFK